MSDSIDRDVFVQALTGSLDRDQAVETLEQAADYASIAWRDQYPQDEALELAHALTELDDVKLFVNVSGNTLKARIQSGSI